MNRAQRRQAARRNRKAGTPDTPVRAASDAPAGADAADVRRDMETATRLYRSGDAVNAAQIYQRVLATDPDNADALHYLGLCAGDMGRLDTAMGLVDRSIALHPECAIYHNNRGNILRGRGRPEEAEEAYRRAVGIDPRDTRAWNNLGITLAGRQLYDAAARAFRRAIGADGSFAEAHNNLANVLHIQGGFDAAETSYRRAIEADPGYFMAYNNLANTLSAVGRRDEAIAACRRAVEIEPAYAGGYNTLASLLQGNGEFAEADAAFRKSIALDPGNAGTWNNFGNALKNVGGHAEAIVCFEKALEIDPQHSMAHSNLLFCMGMDANSTAREIFTQSQRWNEIHARPRAVAGRPHANDRDPDRRLRVGYVSPDFRNHAVSHFIEPLFDAHDRDAVAVIAYAHVAAPDETTQRIRARMDGWCDTVGMTHAELAARIRADRIDILVDLAGHTASNRLLTFAEKPAPVQATWLGYGGTTGLDAMDYRVTDAVADPQGDADRVHSETLVRLACGFLCYAPPGDAPEPGPPPADRCGFVTFASFNSLAKVTPQAASNWARVLKAVPDARLIIKGSPFSDPGTSRRYMAHFAAEGIDEGRIELLAQLPSRQAYLALYHRADIVLDSFPYNGGTTTCEALWMGVPVVTLAGDRHVSRMSASILGRVGADDLVAHSEDEYVAIAARLARDRSRLGDLRAGLRATMAASPLCDGPAFARAMETAYRDMWRRWCAS